ncbi:rod shape-determining protein MreC [Pannus brasiliensis CCIBt3594]|uniref:Cell shape-determining protein MreC n=1 Tax=Pannus brasiliensis CCIBt3594 TaxID=1427578 RepID=A0AAW9QTT9_9CHRO
MYSARRKWTRQGIRLVLIALALAGAWYIRAYRGSAILELYGLITRPFQGEEKLATEQFLADQRVRELQNRLSEVEYQNQQLKTLLGYYKAQKQPVITSPIIGRSADDWWREIVIGRGSADGIKVGASVTGTGGLVGRVTTVTPHTSRVMLVSNANSRVGATIGRGRSMGLIQGRDSQIATLRFFEKAPDVKVGDVVTTSNVSRLFTPGLPIGRVISVNLEQNPAPTAQIEFTATVNHLEWVFVHPVGEP